jgi:hypothetical protein
MRIALVAPIFQPVPPARHGGTQCSWKPGGGVTAADGVALVGAAASANGTQASTSFRPWDV